MDLTDLTKNKSRNCSYKTLGELCEKKNVFVSFSPKVQTKENYNYTNLNNIKNTGCNACKK